jgi:hypothetical protein
VLNKYHLTSTSQEFNWQRHITQQKTINIMGIYLTQIIEFESATSAKLDTNVKTPWGCHPRVDCNVYSRLWFLMVNSAMVSTEQNISNKSTVGKSG